MNKLLQKFNSFFGKRSSARISFRDGTYMTFSEASRRLKKEGLLRSGPCVILDGVIIRDTVGVIENHQPRLEYDSGSDKSVVHCYPEHNGMKNEWFRICLYAEGDTQPKEIGYKNDEDSMKIRAKHMSEYLGEYTNNIVY